MTDYVINESIAKSLVAAGGKVEDWNNCFAGNGWLKELHPEAWKHPARVSFGLAERIYKEALQRGWIERGMTVLDPFLGVGGCGFHAVTNGINFTGVEIEPSYYEMARKNMDLWRDRYAGKLPKFGEAKLYLGDSQEICKLVGDVKIDAIISSPTYSELKLHNPDPAAQKLFREKSIFYGIDENYGRAEGQTGNMKPDKYWEVQSIIADQLLRLLKPGGIAIFIVKRYMRNKKLVEFPSQWAEFYENKGMKTIAWIRAWQLDKNGKQLGMMGEDKSLDKNHLSYFRIRYARMVPSAAILWEDLIVMKKPSNEKRILKELGYG